LADDSGEAIEIIGALSDAGLLRTAASGAPSGAARLIGVLGEAGLLATATAAPGGAAAGSAAGAAPPSGAQAAAQEGPQVGDIVWVSDIWHINKSLEEPDGPLVMEFQSQRAAGQWWQVQIAFPPNEEGWLVEIEKVLAAGWPSALNLKVEVTSAPRVFPTSRVFSANVVYFVGLYRAAPLPAPPNVP